MTMLVDVIRAWAADPNAGPFIPRSELREEPREELSGAVLTPEMFDRLREEMHRRPSRDAAVFNTPFSPNSVFSRLLTPNENLTVTGMMIEDANRLRPRFEDYTVAEDIDEDAVSMVQGGREVGRITGLGHELEDVVDVQRRFNDTSSQLLPITEAPITRMPCMCMQSGCEHCGPWLRPYPELNPPTTELSTARIDETIFAYPPVPESNRPHRRVRPGLCRCNYTSMFVGDMDRHIECANAPLGPPQAAADGILRRWMPCDRCFDYGPCREVRSSVYQTPGSVGSFPHTTGMNLETVNSYRCDECIEVGR